MSEVIIIKNTVDRLSWNWEPEYNFMPLGRIVSIPCVEIEDGPHGFFLSCPRTMAPQEVALEVRVLKTLGDEALPMLLCLEDEPDGRKLVIYFLNSEDAVKYLVQRMMVTAEFNQPGGAPIFVKQP